LVLPHSSDAAANHTDTVVPGIRKDSDILPANAELNSQEISEISHQDLFAFLKKRRGILDGVCISGGEPTLHRDLPNLIREIRALGYLVKLDTNGTNPRMLSELLKEGLLDYVAMDIKAGHSNYAAVAGLGYVHCAAGAESNAIAESGRSHSLLDAVNQSVSLLMNSSIDYEFRMTVVQGLHTEQDFYEIADWIGGCRRYFLQSFRDCDSILQPNHSFSAFSEDKMHHFLKIAQSTIPAAAIRGED
jgi:pyruvate formate lyase activating enzyme